MAATKRKADQNERSDAKKQKRKSSTDVVGTAALDRPKRAKASTAAAAIPTKAKAATAKLAQEVKKKVKKVKPVKEAKSPVKQSKTAAAKETKKKPLPKKEAADSDEDVAKPKAKPPATGDGVALGAGHDRGPGEEWYWLMKAEPESRIEKGVDVKFSIQDLEARSKPEPWDGVRNTMAQKNMRTMKEGDLAFFYHSNCKVPGIAGVMKIVQERSVDESAFDPKHPYYDEKSIRDKPKWCVVHVEHVRTFDNFISLKELQKHSQNGGALDGMQVLRMSRLSVSQVSKSEWEFILRSLVGINPKELKSS